MINFVVALFIVLSGVGLSNGASSPDRLTGSVSGGHVLPTVSQAETLFAVLYKDTSPRLTHAEATAIRWFKHRIGSTSYEGRCELAVETAFGTSGQYVTARANWNARRKHYPYSEAPRGALVFYNTSRSGHVALSLGDGRVLSTSVGGRIGIAPIGYFQNPLGWAYSPWR
jgi:hypothetical protein